MVGELDYGVPPCFKLIYLIKNMFTMFSLTIIIIKVFMSQKMVIVLN